MLAASSFDKKFQELRNMKNQFLNYFQAVYKPRKTFEELISQENLYKRSLVYISIPIVCYTLLYIFLTMANGAPSTLTPWLNISRSWHQSVQGKLKAVQLIKRAMTES
jgi:hypothetical protein